MTQNGLTSDCVKRSIREYYHIILLSVTFIISAGIVIALFSNDNLIHSPIFYDKHYKHIFKCDCVTENSQNFQKCDVELLQKLCYMNDTLCCEDKDCKCHKNGPAVCAQGDKYTYNAASYAAIGVFIVAPVFLLVFSGSALMIYFMCTCL